MENDPGASSGSGLAYERPPEKENQDPSKDDLPESKKPKLSIVSELDKVGMTEVVKDFYELKKIESPVSHGLTTRYQADSSKTKGLLLNKKAE